MRIPAKTQCLSGSVLYFMHDLICQSLLQTKLKTKKRKKERKGRSKKEDWKLIVLTCGTMCSITIFCGSNTRSKHLLNTNIETIHMEEAKLPCLYDQRSPNGVILWWKTIEWRTTNACVVLIIRKLHHTRMFHGKEVDMFMWLLTWTVNEVGAMVR